MREDTTMRTFYFVHDFCTLELHLSLHFLKNSLQRTQPNCPWHKYISNKLFARRVNASIVLNSASPSGLDDTRTSLLYCLHIYFSANGHRICHACYACYVHALLFFLLACFFFLLSSFFLWMLNVTIDSIVSFCLRLPIRQLDAPCNDS